MSEMAHPPVWLRRKWLNFRRCSLLRACSGLEQTIHSDRPLRGGMCWHNRHSTAAIGRISDQGWEPCRRKAKTKYSAGNSHREDLNLSGTQFAKYTYF